MVERIDLIISFKKSAPTYRVTMQKLYLWRNNNLVKNVLSYIMEIGEASLD
jgi:hypothetical protein